MSDIRFEQIKVLTVRLRNKLLSEARIDDCQLLDNCQPLPLFSCLIIFNSSDPHKWGAGGQCSRVGCPPLSGGPHLLGPPSSLLSAASSQMEGVLHPKWGGGMRGRT